MALPRYPRVRFKKSPLRLVVGQVRFPIRPRYADNAFIAPFQEALGTEYPRVTREQQVGIQVTPTGIGTSQGELLWRFSTRDNLWAVVLGESAVTLEARRYSSVDEFTDRFRKILGAAAEYLDVSERMRLGFRCINEIRHPEANALSDWSELLRPELLGFAASGFLGGRVDHTLQEVRVQDPEGITGTLLIRHGLLTGAVVALLPNEQQSTGPFYLLDLDCFDETEDKLSIPETVALMREYNNVLYRLFRWTLRDRLYDYLEPELEPQNAR